MTPLRFPRGPESPNRLWVAPMTNKASHEDGTLSDDELGFLSARARGGFGVVESCATHVTPEGQGWPGELAAFDDSHAPGWRRLAGEIGSTGSLLFAQLFHGGARALRTEEHPVPWSCSPSEPGVPEENEVAQATPERIESTIDAFARAAKRMEDAGVHGVELHGAHGYLLCQFLSSAMNRRTDQWGGDLRGRARLIRETMRRARAAVSDDFIVGVRLSPESSPNLPGLDLDESVQTARWLCEDGADFVHISLWDAGPNTRKRPDRHAASIFREAIPDEVPLITAGKIWTAEDAIAQLDHGADAVALGRAAIANPDWPTRVANAGEEPRRPPLTEAELAERALGPVFIDYMKRWEGFVRG